MVVRIDKRHLVLLLAVVIALGAGVLSLTRVGPGERRGGVAEAGIEAAVDLPTPPALAVPTTATTETTAAPAVTAAAAPAAPAPRVTPATRAPAPRPPARPGVAAPGGPLAPVRVRIDAIGASAAVDPLGLNRDGSLAVPKDFNRAGWYTGRPPPGAIGPAIIVAHVDSKAGPAVFYRLDELKPGDEVTITRADGSNVVFVVDRLEQHPKNAFPTAAVYEPTPDATLRLITCGGTFDRASRHYRDNIIAFAHLKA